MVLKSFRKDCQAKKRLMTDKKTSDKWYEDDFKVWDRFEMKTMKDYRDFYLKCDKLLLADVFAKFRNSS